MLIRKEIQMKQKDLEFNMVELDFIRQEIQYEANKFLDKGKDVPKFLNGILKKVSCIWFYHKSIDTLVLIVLYLLLHRLIHILVHVVFVAALFLLRQ